MKKINLYLFLLLPILNFGQTGIDNCKKHKESAIENFKNGFGIVGFQQGQFSSLSKEESDLILFKKIYFYTKYKIHYSVSLPAGCFIQLPTKSEAKCNHIYKDTFTQLIKQKFGENFEEKSNKQAKKEYEKLKNSSKENFKKYIDTTLVYNFTESYPKFIGNQKTFDVFLRNFILTNFTPKQIERTAIKIIFGIDGKINKCLFGNIVTNELEITDSRLDIHDKIIIETNEFSELEKKLKIELNNLGNWIPAYLYYSKIKFSFNFTELNYYIGQYF